MPGGENGKAQSDPKKVELTREQRISAAWDQFESYNPDAKELTPSVPACRLLKVGDKVELGNLKDCVVAELSNDGRFVLVEYTSVDTNYGKPIFTEGRMNVWPWYEVFALDQIEPTRLTTDRLRPTFIQSDLSSLLSLALDRGVIDNPDYQRGYVWTLEDKQRLIASVMAERNIGSFLFVKYDYEAYKGKLVVLDGKQRLNALVEFYTGRYMYEGKFYHQLSRIDRARFESHRVAYAHLDGQRMSRAKLLEMFLEMNEAGVPQSEEHLNMVRELLAKEKTAES